MCYVVIIRKYTALSPLSLRTHNLILCHSACEKMIHNCIVLSIQGFLFVSLLHGDSSLKDTTSKEVYEPENRVIVKITKPKPTNYCTVFRQSIVYFGSLSLAQVRKCEYILSNSFIPISLPRFPHPTIYSISRRTLLFKSIAVTEDAGAVDGLVFQFLYKNATFSIN